VVDAHGRRARGVHRFLDHDRGAEDRDDAGQLVAATAIDRFGWFGFERVGLDWPRLLGLALLSAGAALTLWR
jgi:hypothetical protein